MGPNFTRPAAPHSGYSPPAQIDAQRLSVGQDVPANWYTLFGSEPLNALVEQALRANPDLDAARHSLSAAQYELHAVAGTALPQIVLGTRDTRARVNGSFLYDPTKRSKPQRTSTTLALRWSMTSMYSAASVA